MRSKFVDIYFEGKHNEKTPLAIFDFHKKIKEAGHFEAYNYWLLSYGNMEEFNSWLKENKDEFGLFISWMKNNLIVVDYTNKFTRAKLENN